MIIYIQLFDLAKHCQQNCEAKNYGKNIFVWSLLFIDSFMVGKPGYSMNIPDNGIYLGLQEKWFCAFFTTRR